MPDLLVAAGRLVRPGADGPGWVLIADSRIAGVGTGEPPRPPDARFELVLPPFVDMHTHGAAGVDFCQLGVDPAPAIAHHRANGSTTVVATIATGGQQEMCDRIVELAPLVHDGTLAGIHLEGPWLSQSRRGAHEPALLQSPSAASVHELVEAGDGTVAMVTIAPELPGALEAIAWLAANGVTPALGHTAADSRTVLAAIDAGARVVTHLFNGMPPLHHREVGLVGVALTDDQLWVELIGDGQHVSDPAVDLAVRCADDRLVLVSDAMAATGLGDGDYEVAGSVVRVRDGVARLAAGDSLAGSTSVVLVAVERLLGRGVDPSRLRAWTNSNPVAALGLPAPQLRVGDRADLLGFTAGRLARVLHAGAWLS